MLVDLFLPSKTSNLAHSSTRPYSICRTSIPIRIGGSTSTQKAAATNRLPSAFFCNSIVRFALPDNRRASSTADWSFPSPSFSPHVYIYIYVGTPGRRRGGYSRATQKGKRCNIARQTERLASFPFLQHNQPFGYIIRRRRRRRRIRRKRDVTAATPQDRNRSS